MSVSTILNAKRGFVRSSEFLATSLALAAALLSLSAFADVESLAETGGCVPTNAPALAFKDITLADLGTTYFPAVKKTGGWAGGEAEAPLFCRSETRDGSALASVSYQAQWYDGGYIKAATIEFTEGVGGVYAQLTGAKAKGSGVQAAYGTDFTGDTNAYTTDSDDGKGYALRDLRLVTAGDVDSISLNFFHSTYKLYGTADVGPSAYAVNVKGWSQLVGNNGSLYGLTLVGKDNGSEFYPALAATATISGTRGSYSYSSYNSTSSLLYGYIDENENNTTPTVTISNVPFEFYKVVFYASTDNDDIRFGYVSVNGVNYNSGNSEKDDTQPYETTTGTAEWGKSRVADYIEGVNYLVTPVLAATSDGSVKVVGHKQTNGRGCIAAVQIIKATVPEIASTDITAAQINAVVPSGESFLRVPAGTTLTLDEALTASKVKFASDGTITLFANGQPSAEELAKLDFACVKGSVLRSWLTPGVVGFNFNADGYRSDNTSTTVDACSDTEFALEIGTWLKNARDASGTSTDLFADGLSTLTWTSANLYAERWNISSGTFIQGYLDDGNGGTKIMLSNVPYATYDVIIYCSTDNSTKSFKAKTVNGTVYKWDSATGQTVVAGGVNETWGLASTAAGKAVYGANTLRINGLSGPLSIMGGTNSDNARGCISAIQIMPAGTSTAPEMTVGSAGQTTQTTWTGANWNVATAPTSGNVIINLSGDVELTVDETVALSAITVNGEGSLTIIPDQPHNVTLTASSISSAIPVLFANDGIGIGTISASITYLYKTPSIKSSTYGATYTAGVGSRETSVAINHNGGSVVLDGTAGEIYWLSQSNSDTSTAVTFTNATVNYSNGLSVGMANYTVGGASVITTTPNSDNNHSFYLSDGQASRTASFILKDTSVVNVSGASDVDSNQASILFGHWNGPSTFTIQDEAAFNAVAQVLVGKTSNNHTININGGTFTARGIKASAGASGANTLNLNGGLLVLGDVGITSYGSTTIGVNVSANSEIRASAATLPISQSMTLGANTTLSFTKANDVSAATVSLTGAVSGSGDISVGPGVTLNLGTSRPASTITVADGGVLAVQMQSAGDIIELTASAQPANVILYDANGNAFYNPRVNYSDGTLTITPAVPTLEASGTVAFDNAGNWVDSMMPSAGDEVILRLSGDATIAVSGTYTLGTLTITGTGAVTFTGNGTITPARIDVLADATYICNGTVVSCEVPHAIYGTLKTVGDAALTSTGNAIDAAGVLDVESGTLALTCGNRTLKGAIYVRSGATLAPKTEDGFNYSGTQQMHIYGTLSMGTTRWTTGGNNTIYLYGGASVTGGGNSQGNIDMNATGAGHIVVKRNETTGDAVVNFSADLRSQNNGNGTIAIDPGVTLVMSGKLIYQKKITKSGSGALVFDTPEGSTGGYVWVADGAVGGRGFVHNITMDNGTELQPAVGGLSVDGFYVMPAIISIVTNTVEDVTTITTNSEQCVALNFSRVDPDSVSAGDNLTLLSVDGDATLSTGMFDISGARYETTVSEKTVTATVKAGVPANYLHYDFNGGANNETAKAADSGAKIASFGEAEGGLSNGRAAKVFYTSASRYTPYWGEYNTPVDASLTGKSPMHAGEMTVTTVAKLNQTNMIIWGLGTASLGDAVIGLVALSPTSAAVVTRNTSGIVDTVVTISNAEDLTNGYHFFAVVANASGTTLYVDSARASSEKVVPREIKQFGQIGSFHNGAQNVDAPGANLVGADGFLLDDWRVYDAALTAKEIKALKRELNPDPLFILLR